MVNISKKNFQTVNILGFYNDNWSGFELRQMNNNPRIGLFLGALRTLFSQFELFTFLINRIFAPWHPKRRTKASLKFRFPKFLTKSFGRQQFCKRCPILAIVSFTILNGQWEISIEINVYVWCVSVKQCPQSHFGKFFECLGNFFS